MTMGLELEYRFSKLEELVKRAADRNLDELTASYFCRLGSVLICGNIERCFEIIVLNWARRKCPEQVGNFFRRYFNRGTNYDCEEIKNFLYRLDKAWGERFEAFVADHDEVSTSISSCYAVRNSVAHGGGGSLGPKSLRQYFDASFSLIAELDDIVK